MSRIKYALTLIFIFFGNIAFAGERSNILLIMADDLGFSDVGAFGSEIKTPNIDDLAFQGQRWNQFYVAPACSPTRAMLMSGTDNHLAGLSTLAEVMSDEQKGKPGFEGYLNFKSLSFVELLRQSGYHTYMVGKWHLGDEPDQGPAARGFMRSFSLIDGAAHHFDKTGFWQKAPVATYREDGREVTKLPDDFYSTDFFTDKIIDYIDRDLKDSNPFFAYVSFTAPHWPLQAPESDIKKYKGVYDSGYRTVAEARKNKQKKLGIFDKNSGVEDITQLDSPLFDWNSLSDDKRNEEARRMEIYAAMVDRMDQNIGRIIDFLKEKGVYEDTMIVFLSDNGPDGANLSKASWLDWKWVEDNFDNSYENMGKKGSFVSQGAAWAQVSATPFNGIKNYTKEGGITSPLIISYPKVIKKNSIVSEVGNVMDLAPTFLEVAGVSTNIKEYRGREINPIKGDSLLGFISGKSKSIHGENYVVSRELYGRRSIMKDGWKAVWTPVKNQETEWELYNIKNDRGEKKNLALDNQEILGKLKNEWGKYAKENGIDTAK